MVLQAVMQLMQKCMSESDAYVLYFEWTHQVVVYAIELDRSTIGFQEGSLYLTLEKAARMLGSIVWLSGRRRDSASTGCYQSR